MSGLREVDHNSKMTNLDSPDNSTNPFHFSPPDLASGGNAVLDCAEKGEVSAQTESYPEVRPDNLPVVWACIAVFNRIRYTRKCLEQLTNQTYPNIKPVVVDDGSKDGTSAMIATNYPDVVLLQGDGLLYWTPAMHLGLSHIIKHAAPHDYVLLLNDDLLFSENFVEQLIQKSQLHPRALIQAVESCVDDPDLVWQGGALINWWTARHRLVNYHRRISSFPREHFEMADYLTARGVLVPMGIIHTIGNYDPRFKQCGDGEFTRRAAKHGFSLLVTYDVSVLSYEKGHNLNETESYSLSDLKKFYFGILSNYRLSTRWLQATTMTTSGIQALVFFFIDVIRITIHFVTRIKSPFTSLSRRYAP